MSKPRKKKRPPKRVLALPNLEQSKAAFRGGTRWSTLQAWPAREISPRQGLRARRRPTVGHGLIPCETATGTH